MRRVPAEMLSLQEIEHADTVFIAVRNGEVQSVMSHNRALNFFVLDLDTAEYGSTNVSRVEYPETAFNMTTLRELLSHFGIE